VGDPSLRLKNGSVQDDAEIFGFGLNYSDYKGVARAFWVFRDSDESDFIG
jgi:hypothetical protein